MADQLNASARFEADASPYLAAINQVINANTRLQAQYPQLASALGKQEKALANAGAATKGMIAGATGAAGANNALNNAANKSTSSIIAQRYALYDVSRSFAAVSAATLGFSLASAKVAIDFQKDFASVQRTTGATGAQFEQMKQSLIDLSTTIPTTVADLAQIATLGGQLGIAASGITDFTSVVAKLTATTDLSAEAAGTALGRFQALLGVPSSKFENVASAILKVGVNSVATESQITNIATQISSMGKFAGLTADQVVGLSGALASTGTQPELARGTITRLFTKMSVAVSAGGDALTKFAQVSGVSADQFKAAWGTDQFASVFQKFLQGIEGSGQNAVQVLKDVGISSVRDVPALTRLAGAQAVVNSAFSDAATGYKDGTELGKQYAITAGTVSAKLTELGNTIQAILANSAGGLLAPLAGTIDMLKGLAGALKAFAGTGVGQVLGGVVLTISALIGVLAGLKAMETLVTASAYAFITATEGIAASTLGANGGLTSMAAKMTLLTLGTARATAAQAAYDAAIAGGQMRLVAWTKAAYAAVVGTQELSLGFKGLLVSAGALGTIGLAIGFVVGQIQQMNSISSYYGDVTGLADALKSDTVTFNNTGKAIRTIRAEISTSSDGLAGWAQDLSKASGAQVNLTDNTRQTTTAVKEQNIAIGDNAKAWLANAVANDKAFQDYYKNNQELLKNAGFNLGEFLNASLNTQGGGTAYIDNLIKKVDEVRLAQTAAIPSTTQYNTEVQKLEATANQARGTLGGLKTIAEANDSAFSNASAQAEVANAVYAALGITATGTGDAISTNLNTKLQDMIDLAYGSVSSTVDVQNAIATLGTSLGQNGTSFDQYSASGRLNLEALQKTFSAMVTASAGDSGTLATYIQGLMQTLASYGVDTVGQLSFVQDALAQLTGGQGTAGLSGVSQAAAEAANALGQGFSTGADKAAKSASKATAEVKTLTDYVGNLGTVFRNAFDIRFGLTESLDTTSASWAKMADYADNAKKSVNDATQAILDADAKIRGLNTNNSTLTYQLQVAQQYGDTLRANEILAQMTKNNADLTSAQSDRTKATNDLIKAQEASTKTLTGDSQAAQDQRGLVLDLVKSYEDQVRALANTGLSQEDLARKTAVLKQQFITQLTQMGYNRVEVGKYAAAFDDLTASIGRVPRDINVSANTDPAQRAIDEFLAKNANRSVSVSTKGGSSSFGTVTADMFNTKAFTTDSTKLFNSLVFQQGQTPGQYVFRAQGGPVPEYHAVGGPVGTDTVPAYLTPGEWVQQKSAVDYYGLPFMNAINNMQIPRYLASGGPVTSGGGSSGGIQLVEILPNQIEQIAQAVSTILTVDGKVLASTVNAHNTGNARRGIA